MSYQANERDSGWVPECIIIKWKSQFVKAMCTLWF
jgi:hypothetical protein